MKEMKGHYKSEQNIEVVKTKSAKIALTKTGHKWH
jgi:hypothetical protein